MGKSIKLRDATTEDGLFFWELANDALVRQVSFSPEPISWETHKAWFEKKLSETGTFLFVAEDEQGRKAGQLRFEKKDGDHVISVSLADGFRGKGLGSKLIEKGSDELFERCPETRKILAYIKHNNIASIRSFEKPGYQNCGFATIKKENDAVLMVRKNTYSTM